MNASLLYVQSVHVFQTHYCFPVTRKHGSFEIQHNLWTAEGTLLLPSAQGDSEIFAIQWEMLLGCIKKQQPLRVGKLYRYQFMLEDPEIAHVSQMQVYGLAWLLIVEGTCLSCT